MSLRHAVFLVILLAEELWEERKVEKNNCAHLVCGFEMILHVCSSSLFCLFPKSEPTKLSLEVKQNNLSVLDSVKHCQCKEFSETTCPALGPTLKGLAARSKGKWSLSPEKKSYDSSSPSSVFIKHVCTRL